jgi:hypothetical protein
MEPAMSADSTDRPDRRPSIEELARQQGVRAVGSVDDLAREDGFTSDAEVEEFIAFVRAMRRADVA